MKAQPVTHTGTAHADTGGRRWIPGQPSQLGGFRVQIPSATPSFPDAYAQESARRNAEERRSETHGRTQIGRNAALLGPAPLSVPPRQIHFLRGDLFRLHTPPRPEHGLSESTLLGAFAPAGGVL